MKLQLAKLLVTELPIHKVNGCNNRKPETYMFRLIDRAFELSCPPNIVRNIAETACSKEMHRVMFLN